MADFSPLMSERFRDSVRAQGMAIGLKGMELDEWLEERAMSIGWKGFSAPVAVQESPQLSAIPSVPIVSDPRIADLERRFGKVEDMPFASLANFELRGALDDDIRNIREFRLKEQEDQLRRLGTYTPQQRAAIGEAVQLMDPATSCGSGPTPTACWSPLRNMTTQLRAVAR